MMFRNLIGSAALAAALAPTSAQAFCGFFVGKADAQLFNQASQVVMVHDAGKTVLTMVNDYQGEPKDFALVVPVPVVLKKEVVRVADMAPIDHLDAFTAPRLAEYHDPNPCRQDYLRGLAKSGMAAPQAMEDADESRARRPKVRVEASFTVGEYDIVILSAEESNALQTWLQQNGYNIPDGASRALRPYVRSGLKFFVAKVNLKKLKQGGFQKLRPLQFAFKDPRFMLPIRLGMLNSQGPQDLIAYVITRQHRAEVTNYRNVKMPSDVNIPTFVKASFPEMYKATFDHQVQANHGRAVFTEYAWNMAWCDPCAADPLAREELEKLGVWWLGADTGRGGAQQAFVTRLHARYDPSTFPEDLMLKVTSDTSNYQVRYVLQNPYEAPVQCDAAAYFNQVHERRKQEVQQLARLTGWRRADIQERMTPLPPHFESASEPTYLDQIRDWFGE